MQEIPQFLYKKLQSQYGEELTKKIANGYSKQRYATLRANTIKTEANNVAKELQKAGIKFDKVNWSDNAFIIKNATESDIRNLSIYKNGEIYMQSLSSMIPAIILSPNAGENILDMTAAPGGKTTQIAALSNNQCFITACEKNKIRLDRLKYNLEKQGVTSTNVMNIDARKLDDFFSFDKVLLDAPCSGSGTLNTNDKNLEKYFTKELIQRSEKTQSELLQKAINVLKPGNEMVYSTCSILQEENEENIQKYIKKGLVEIVAINLKQYEEIPKLPTKIEGTMCICPDELYEGFFVAKLRKKTK